MRKGEHATGSVPSASTSGPAPRPVPSERIGEGRRLDAGTAARMGSALGHSFADVRIHDDPAAHSFVARERAVATTVGTDIAFAPGAYQPGTAAGDALLAHELAHVQQQRDATTASPIAGDHNALERDADQATIGALARLHGLPELGGSRGASRRSPRSVQRCEAQAQSWAPAMPPGSLTVPAGGSAGMLTGPRVDTMLTTSAIVGPYVAGRINPTGACAGSPRRSAGHTRFYERAEFRDAYTNYLSRRSHPQHLGACGRPYNQTEARAEPLVDGFADDDAIRILATADPATPLHEALHMYQSDAFAEELGLGAMEGTTEYFTAEVLAEQAAGTAPAFNNAYRRQETAIRRAVVQGGVGNRGLCEAYFNGDFAAMRTAMNRLDAGKYERWKGFMRSEDYLSANAEF
jgi:hypothetical protein